MVSLASSRSGLKIAILIPITLFVDKMLFNNVARFFYKIIVNLFFMKTLIVVIFFGFSLLFANRSFSQVDSAKLLKTEQRMERNKKDVDKMNKKIARKENKIKRQERKTERKEKKRDRELKRINKQERELDKIRKDSTN